jgi:hypothetical protein
MRNYLGPWKGSHEKLSKQESPEVCGVIPFQKLYVELDMVGHTNNPRTQEAEAGRFHA